VPSGDQQDNSSLQPPQARVMDENQPIPSTQPAEPYRYDLVQDFSDHHFRDAPTVIGRTILTRILRECGSLRTNLPDNVYVRSYEGRMELMRVMIIGPDDTPYRDCPFFFDVYFSLEYPQVPPHVYFCPMGRQLNPNLYTDGTVCLSLLGTWSGKGVENWDPKTSTILQVIVSIQGLILGISEPYFLEPGYEKQKGTPAGDQASHVYNENAILISLGALVTICKQPPKHFEEIIRFHFSRRGPSIIERCQRCIEHGDSLGAPLSEPTSQGFKKALAGILVRLRSILNEQKQ